MSDTNVIFGIMITVVGLFVWGRLPVMIVALMMPLALFLFGVLPLDQVFAGFGDPIIIFIVSLFIVAAGLEAAGITAWVGRLLASAVRASPDRLSAFTVLIVAVLTPLISQSGAVAALVPLVTLMALRMKQSPSKFLMPLAFASAAGSMLALTGTSKNVLVSSAVADAGYGEFGFFEFAWVGIPLLLGTLLVVAVLGQRLLPDRPPPCLPKDFGQHARTLTDQYAAGSNYGLYRLLPHSPLLGNTREAVDQDSGVNLIAISGMAPHKTTSKAFAVGDVLVLCGNREALSLFADRHSLSPVAETDGSVADILFNRHAGLAEVVVRPRSQLVGTVMSPGTITDNGQLVVVAIQRNGEDLGGAHMGEGDASPGVALRAGDHLLLQGTWQALESMTSDPDIMIVDSPDMVRRQSVPLGPGSSLMLSILAVMVLVLATGLLPAPIGVLVAAMAVVAAGIISVPQAYRAVDWNTVILVASMIPLSTAMYQSGAATELTDVLVAAVGNASPTMLVAGLFVLTALLGEVISNTATTMIMIPIAVTAAAELGISAKPVLMSVNVGASAAFLTPVATASNLIVMGPGGYHFGDYWKLGIFMMGLYFLVAVFWVPLVWRF